jgi:hypothetical protein
VVADLEEKGPQILRQREEWQAAVSAHAQAAARLEAALGEAEQLRHSNRVLAAERRQRQGEAEALERHNRDLSLQCRQLLKEVEGLRRAHAAPAVQLALARAAAAEPPPAPAEEEAWGGRRRVDADAVITDELVGPSSLGEGERERK